MVFQYGYLVCTRIPAAQLGIANCGLKTGVVSHEVVLHLVCTRIPAAQLGAELLGFRCDPGLQVLIFNLQVSLILFKLNRTEALLQVCDTGVVFSTQVSQVLLHQPGNIGYDEFYGKFSSPKGASLASCLWLKV